MNFAAFDFHSIQSRSSRMGPDAWLLVLATLLEFFDRREGYEKTKAISEFELLTDLCRSHLAVCGRHPSLWASEVIYAACSRALRAVTLPGRVDALNDSFFRPELQTITVDDAVPNCTMRCLSMYPGLAGGSRDDLKERLEKAKLVCRKLNMEASISQAVELFRGFELYFEDRILDCL